MAQGALVLVVDDRPDARYVRSRALTAAGLRVIEAASVRETFQQAGSHSPDVILLDVELPDGNGLDACRRLREDSKTAGCAIIQISAHFDRPIDQVNALDIGADAFLPASAEPAVLVATVRALIRMRRAEAALRETDQRKDEFLAVLAHEIRNPLGALRMALAYFEHAPMSDASMVRARDIMLRQIGQLKRLIDDLSDLSRIRRGKIELRRTRIDVIECVRAAIETTHAAIGAAHHTLHSELPETPIHVMGDPERLQQVFSNLLSNAAKYTPQGGALRIRATRSGPYAEVAVTDNGIGIAPEDLSRVFELFVQLHNHERASGEGLGIGLALVRRLVELHGGMVNATSAGLGHGSTFSVTLPVAGEGSRGD